LWSLPFLNLKKSWQGKIISLGKDGLGNEIYGLSVKGERGMVHRLVESFLSIYKIPEGEVRLVDSGAEDNLLLLAGMLMCRSKFLTPLGRLLASAGIRKPYGGIVGLVLEVKAGLANLP
jgi:hypothetical protein